MDITEIGRFADIKSGFAFKSDYFSNVGTPLVRIGNLNGSTIQFAEETVCIPEEIAQVSKDFYLKQNDVVIAMSGATTGKVAIVQQKDLPCLLNQRVGKFTVDSSKLDYRYLYYFLSFDKVKENILKISGGSAQPNISPNQLKQLKIPIRILSEQQKIAQILSEADKARQLRTQANALTDQFLQSTFLSMFGDPAVNEKGFKKIELKNFYSKRKEGTKCGPFGSALKRDEYTTQGIPVWVMDNIRQGRFEPEPFLYITPEKYNQLKSYSVENGDIIISRAGTVGKMCVVETDFSESIISTNLISLSLDSDKLLPVYFVTLMTHFASRVGKLRKGEDGAFTHMNTGILNNLEIPAPPIKLQQQFADIVSETEQLRQRQRAHEQELDQLFKGLLQKYFRS